jgi:hypothetical protein
MAALLSLCTKEEQHAVIQFFGAKGGARGRNPLHIQRNSEKMVYQSKVDKNG